MTRTSAHRWTPLVTRQPTLQLRDKSLRRSHTSKGRGKNSKGGSESSTPCRSVVVTIQEELHSLPKPCPTKNRCIYRVPKWIRGVKKEAYTPIVVSIGPFHRSRKDERLLPMETYKLRFLDSFIKHSEKKGRGSLSTYIEMVKDSETQIRDSYAERIPMPSHEFVRMVLVDSAFIIGLIQYNWHTDIMPAINYAHMYHDLMLAENQLPFFILVQLYQAAYRPDDLGTLSNVLSFTEVACNYLNVDKRRVKVDATSKEASNCCHLLDLLRAHYLPSHLGNNRDVHEKGKHLLDLLSTHYLSSRLGTCCGFITNLIKASCRHLLSLLKLREAGSSHLPSHQNTNTTKCKERDTREECPTAMSLREAGVKFRSRVSDKSCSLLDIHFDKRKGILTIPSLHLDDYAETCFTNLIAFEQSQCYPKQTTYIADYFFFMDCLINTSEDVSLLVDAGIIHNLLGSEQEVARLINSLCTHVFTTQKNYYATITEQLNKYRKKRWNRYRATLKHTYFKHPWAVLSVIYAVILLLLTIAQFLTGILALPGIKK